MKWNTFLIGFIVGMVLIFTLLEIKNKCWIGSDAKQERQRVVNILLRGVGRWATAAKNDDSPMIRLLHSNYAAGYLWAILDAFSTNDIEEVSQVPYQKIRDEVSNTQDWSTRLVLKVCPQFGPPESVLTRIAGESL